jgi:hypothetical protein
MNEQEQARYRALLREMTAEQLQQRLEKTKRAMRQAESLAEMQALRLTWIMIESELFKRKK